MPWKWCRMLRSHMYNPRRIFKVIQGQVSAGEREYQSVLGGNESTGRQAPHTVLTKVELRWGGEQQLGLPGWAARRT